MLYCSIHVAAGCVMPSRTILERPEIEHHLKDCWGHEGDEAEIVVTPVGVLIGVAWCRCMEASDPGTDSSTRVSLNGEWPLTLPRGGEA